MRRSQSHGKGIAVAVTELSAVLQDDGAGSPPPSVLEFASNEAPLAEPDAADSVPPLPGEIASQIDQSPITQIDYAEAPVVLDPAVAELCVPLFAGDPCGPDLDAGADADYLNFLAQAEGILPTSFFSADDGKPFDPATVDLAGQIEAIKPLWQRSRDLRLLIMRARLSILNRDLGGFATALAASAEWLDHFWEQVHPHAEGDNFSARVTAFGALDLPTVIFPLQYAPLCEDRRLGAVSYRSWMIAAGEAKPRAGEQKHAVGALSDALASADPLSISATRKHVAMLKVSLGRVRGAFMMHGFSSGIDSLPTLVDKMQMFVDPQAVAQETDVQAVDAEGVWAATRSERANDGMPTSLGEARNALAAIADYYSQSEPSSPILPLVRQAHQLIGKSFFEVMSILLPAQMDKAAFQIGADQFFELPVGKLSKLSETAADGAQSPNAEARIPYRVRSRAQAIGLLEQVQRFFRQSEPSSPVPMLCERARTLAERDFMGVLRDVLPKAALKNLGAEK
jgi:type VI secretion system protein ImpA